MIMKKEHLSRYWSAIILSLPFFSAHAQTIPLPPQWLNDAVFYQIYPQSFKDSDGDGIGDIPGIISKLDYLQWLGVNAIWLNPLFDSPFNDAGYDIRDFYKVAPRYGTNEDLVHLFQEAHKRRIKICLDLVPGHTSIDNKWFQASASADSNAYWNRFIWTNNDTLKPNDKFVLNSFPRKGTYMRNFFESQPAINYGFGKRNPSHPWEMSPMDPGPKANREELFHIIDYWMEKGADGFRVDMAASLIKNDPGYKETDKLWQEIRLRMQTKYPEGILLSEWGHPDESIRAGFTMDFLAQFGNSGYKQLFYNFDGHKIIDSAYFDLRGNGNPEVFAGYIQQQLRIIGQNGFICMPTDNHDRQRPRSGPRNTIGQLKCLMTLIFTIPTVPLVYYGDEIGMRFVEGLPEKEGSITVLNRAGSRTPMQWSSGANAGFSTAARDSLYLPIDRESCIPTVESEISDSFSLLHYTRTLVSLKKQVNAFKAGQPIQFLLAKNETYPLVYTRTDGKETYLVCINPSGKRCTFPYMAVTGKKTSVILKSGTVETMKDSQGVLQIGMGGVSSVVLRIN